MENWISIAIALVASGISLGASSAEEEGVGERFVVLARNDTQEGPRGPALVFEYRAGADALVKRTEMAASDWSPTSMFDEFDGLLRHQVNSPRRRPYEVHFCHLDVDDWTVRQLLVTGQVFGVYGDDARAWLEVDGRIRVFDRERMAFAEDPPQFEVVRKLGGRHALIRRPGAPADVVELFDFGGGEKGKTLARLELPAVNGFGRFKMRDDCGALVYFPGVSLPPGLGFGETAWVDAKLFLYDLRNGNRHVVPFETEVSPGSGLPVIYRSLEMRFTGDGDLELTDGEVPSYVRVNLQTGEKSEPLRPWVRDQAHADREGEQIVALVNEKTDVELPENRYFRFAMLRPGGEFLALAPNGKPFLYGDLKERTVRVLENPSGSVDVSIYALPASP